MRAIGEMPKTRSNTSPQGDMQLSAELIDLAISDLKAAELLFQYRLYPQAVFMTQQSLEKAIKAILLKLKLIRSQELRQKIRHQVITESLELIIHRLIEDFLTLAGSFLTILTNVEKDREVSMEIKNLIREIREKAKAEICKTIQLSSTVINLFRRDQNKLFRDIEKLGKMALQESTEDSEKIIEELLERTSHYNILDLISGEVYDIYAKLFNEIAKLMMVLNKEKQVEISDILKEEIRQIAIYSSLALDLSTLVVWYAPFERNVSRVRYPKREGHSVISPSTIGERTLIVKWSKKVMSVIKDQEIYECIKELIHGRIQSRKCKEKISAYEQYLKFITEVQNNELHSTSLQSN